MSNATVAVSVLTQSGMAPSSGSGSQKTRLFVQGLPKYLNDARFKEIFSEFGEVTDARIIRKNDKSRQFGFIGYKTDQVASRARKHFDGSFIDTSKVQVTFALGSGDSDLARPWSQHSEGSSAWKKQSLAQIEKDTRKDKQRARAAKKSAKEEAKKKHRSVADGDAELAEFLEVMKPRQASKFWANDADQSGEAGAATVKRQLAADGQGSDSDDDEYFMPTESQSSAPVATTEQNKVSELDQFRQSGNIDSSSDDEEPESKPKPSKNSSKSGTDWSEFAENADDGDDSEPENSGEPDKPDETDAPEKSSSSGSFSGEADVEETARLFVRNLPFSATEQDLTDEFQRFGEVAEVHIPIDSMGKAKGFGYVRYALPSDALAALQGMQKGRTFQGRLIHVLAARAAPQATFADDLVNMTDDQSDTLTHKKKLALKRRRQAVQGQDKDSWNSLFIRQDTVAAAIAAQFGVDKADLLGADANNQAVKMALAETHLIDSTKKFMEEHGVNFSAFKGSKKTCKRSRHVILVKNIPYETSEDELHDLFSKFGSLGRVLIPPTKTMALVEFLEAVEAKRGFRNLAYKKFKHTPLYLEWAPEAALAAKSESQSDSSKTSDKKTKASDVLAAGDEDRSGCTLFVKNLNFDTTEKRLKKTFKKVGTLKSVTIVTKENPKYARAKDKSLEKAKLSQGYGFVEFAKASDAKKALKKLDGKTIDGHKIELKISNRGQKRVPKPAEGADSTKMMVKNIPFEASIAELRELFGTFGELKSCRLPKKFGGGHRGFAFLDFVTRQEAKNAMQALSATHLYGRRLVLEWAHKDEDVEELREKTLRQFSAGSDSMTAGQKRKREDAQQNQFQKEQETFDNQIR